MDYKILPGFIVIEGLDGSGTTTQMEQLYKKFANTSITSVKTCEPTDFPTGKLIRQVLLKEFSVHPETLARLFCADRYEHLHKEKTGIIDTCGSGTKVICDRYLFSSLAYQSLNCSFESILELNSSFPLPEHCIFIDTSIKECQNRMESRKNVELFDYLHIQEKIRNNYLRAFKVFSHSKMKMHVINGDDTAEKITQNIWDALKIAD